MVALLSGRIIKFLKPVFCTKICIQIHAKIQSCFEVLALLRKWLFWQQLNMKLIVLIINNYNALTQNAFLL